MAKKYQVFIISTFDDLKEHRDAVVKAVLQLGHLPVGMEMFNAGDQTQWETIKSYIDSSDYYLVVLAHRYGSLDPASGLSYTEKEYDYAGEQGVPRLGFVIDKNASWPAVHMQADSVKELDAFKSKVGSARVIKFWDNADKLTYHVALSLSNEISINPRIGWVRATETAGPQVAEELARLSKENSELLNRLLSQPADEITDLQKFVEEKVMKFPLDDEEIVDVPLKDFFLTTVRVDFAYPDELYEIIFRAMGGITPKGDIFPTTEALEELVRIGVLSVSNDAPGGLFTITDRGQKLYIRLMG